MTRKSSHQERWQDLEDTLKRNVPHVAAVLGRETEFVELRFKARDDGTILSLVKAYDPAGAPVIAFGAGYTVALSLMALDATVNGGNWREDKPWSGNGSGKSK